MTATTLPIPVTDARAAEFYTLFLEFAGTYLSSEVGRAHLAGYAQIRLAGQAAYADLCAQADAGRLDTDAVLLRLLPWTDSAANRKRGAWTHVAPAITGDLKSWFQNAHWTSGNEWPDIARAILSFIRTCVDDPTKLQSACAEFAASQFSKGFQSGFLSPALNAIRPDAFIIGNVKSRTTINHFALTDLSAHLTDYPALNAAGLQLVDEFSETMHHATQSAEPASDLFDAFSHWLVAVKMYDFGATGYWKIAPGEEGHLWAQWLEGGYAAIGWTELGSMEGLAYDEFEIRRSEAIARDPQLTKEALEQVWNFAHIREGDRFLANQGTTKVVGIGRVTGPYYFVSGDEYGHRLPVDWEDTNPRAVKKGGWRKTLIKLNRPDFADVVGAEKTESARDELTERSFSLLLALHSNPTAAYYQAHKTEFKKFVESPLQGLLLNVASRLPTEMAERLESAKRIFAKITKNDYGRGGAWDYYWGAFYTKGAKRIAAPQLFVTINRNALTFGFSIGDNGLKYKSRFAERSAENTTVLVETIGPQLESIGVKFGSAYQKAVEAGKDIPANKSFAEWLTDPESDYTAAISLDRDDVLHTDPGDLEEQILRAFRLLFPLIRLASEDTQIGSSPELGEPDDDEEEADEAPVQPAYSLEQFALDTGIDRDTLEMWIRAIERKGQAILYGPPGTGKTWTAQRLARHLVAGGNGLIELVQFHPAYSYEDFIQGIRPETVGGALSYELAAGRFLDFCGRAGKRSGMSVLIVDEINRANLSRVLGELMYLLEYRSQSNEIPLAGGNRFFIPDQIRIIGTMNTADRSIALVDHALRRRFGFLRLRPNFDVLRKFHAGGTFPIDALVHLIESVNKAIANSDYEVGISFFMDQNLELNLADIWLMEIEPYLDEYFFNDPGKVAPFRWSSVKKEIGLSPTPP